MFEVLNQELESRPEFFGFRDSFQVVFNEMKQKGVIKTSGESYVEFGYDVLITTLDVSNLRKITNYLGFTINNEALDSVAQLQKQKCPIL